MVKGRLIGWVEVGMAHEVVWVWADEVKLEVQKDVSLIGEVN